MVAAAAARMLVAAALSTFPNNAFIDPTGQDRHDAHPDTLRRVRLDHARQDLVAADPARDSVTAIAYRWGFPNPSRFAAQYRQAYGVRPSHTLHRD